MHWPVKASGAPVRWTNFSVGLDQQPSFFANLYLFICLIDETDEVHDGFSEGEIDTKLFDS